MHENQQRERQYKTRSEKQEKLLERQHQGLSRHEPVQHHQRLFRGLGQRRSLGDEPLLDGRQARLAAIQQGLIAQGTPLSQAPEKALMVLNGLVTRQALMLSFEQLFLLFGSCFVLSLPLLVLMHKPKSLPGGTSMAH